MVTFIADFVQYVCAAKTKFAEYGKKILDKEELYWKNKLDNLDREFEHKIGEAETSSLETCEKLEIALKPWHGFPLNRDKLSEINSDAINHCRSVADVYRKIIKRYKVCSQKLVSQNMTLV